jgi:hypothetical protein
VPGCQLPAGQSTCTFWVTGDGSACSGASLEWRHANVLESWSSAPLGSYPVSSGSYDINLMVGSEVCASATVVIGP